MAGVPEAGEVVGGIHAVADTHYPSQTPDVRSWDEQSFFDELASTRGEAELAAARDLYAWTRQRGWRQLFGRGNVDGSWRPVLEVKAAPTRRSRSARTEAFEFG